MLRLLLPLLLCVCSAYAADEVYRWIDKDGVVHYGAQPPNKDLPPAKLPEIQTYSNRLGNKALPIVPAEILAKPPAAPSVKEVRILAPVEDEVFRDPQGIISVSAAVLPALPTGAGVQFYLDGAVKNAKPLTTTNMMFTGVERGEHTVVVAVVDALGKEIARSLPITFHNKPPTVRNAP
jgi:hypothetical protein